MLCSKEAQGFVRKLWQEVGDACVQHTTVGGMNSGMRAAREAVGDLRPVRLPDEGLGVQQVRLADGRVLAIVTMPPPLLMSETYLIGVVLPPDESLQQDLARARSLVRFFILDRWQGERDTDFCRWTIKGEKLTYNVGAPLEPIGFAQAVWGKLEEER